MKKVPQKNLSVMHYLSCAVHEVRLFGYSKQWPSTWYRAWQRGIGTIQGCPEIQDAVRAGEIQGWILSIPFSYRNEYFHAVIHALQQLTMTQAQAPLVASLVHAFETHSLVKQRAQTMTERLQAFRSSVYLGTIGKRRVFELAVHDTEAMDSIYGGTVVFFKDLNGNMAKWIASRVPEQFQGGCFLRVRATVKEHREIHGVRHTVLTRVILDAPKTTSRAKIRSPRCSLRATGPRT